MKTARRTRGSSLHRSTFGDLEQALCIGPCFEST